MGSINQLSFLPDDYLERKAQRRTNAICAVLFVIVLAGVGSAFTLSERATRRLETEDADVEKAYVSAAKRIEQARQMEEKKKRMMHQAELSATLLERIPRSTILAKITNCLPQGVSLLDFQMDAKPRPDAATADSAAPKTAYEAKKAARQQTTDKNAASAPTVKAYDVLMKLTAVCSTDAQVAAMLSQVSKEDLFRDVNLVISEQYKQKGDKEELNLKRFQIEMTLNNDAEVEGSPNLRLRTTSVEVKE